MLKLVLFDIDGTLVRTGGAGVKAFARTFDTEFGLSNGAEKLKFAGRTDVSLVREFFTNHGITPDESHFSRFFERYLFWLNHYIKECQGGICPGVPELLETLHQAAQKPAIGLLTGNIRAGAQVKLGHYGLWEKFAFGGFADDHEERDSIAAAARQRGEKAFGKRLLDEEVLVIGDTPLDIRCGRAIGAKVLAVATGGSTLADLREHKPDWAVEDLSQLDLAALQLA